ncbi:conserved protein of unknown function (plasmid) [Rhodovastum atsumiense]|uniref:hypothetical protein n=1 Tax=Rhodovastum atsumiense TaxID=504468 RepID=UPI00193C6ACD|nr:hypothetical protein [Rhodovastum atsumiense]CAH2606421.1 conserved protein of unknown function [Rhodovastum atsumiense]
MGGIPDGAANKITGTFTAAGAADKSVACSGRFNVSIWGTFVATVVIERSFDGGSTFLPLSTDAYGTAVALTVPCSLVIDEPEAGVIYRLRCTSWTSGSVNWRISQ